MLEMSKSAGATSTAVSRITCRIDVSGKGILVFGINADVGSAEAVGHVGMVDFEFACRGGGTGRFSSVDAGGIGLIGGAAGFVDY